MTYSYKVVRTFIDKESGKVYKAGDEFLLILLMNVSNNYSINKTYITSNISL